MSSAAAVRFPDGNVRYGVYDPAEESMWPPLFDTLEEARAAWDQRGVHPGGWDADDEQSRAEVSIFADHDGGFWWIGEATASAITLGTTWAGIIGSYNDVEWDDEPRTRHRDVPGWAREALGLASRPE